MIDDSIVEVYEENRATGVEAETEDDSTDVIQPWDANKIRVDPKMFSLRQVLEMIQEGELDLAPDFQRQNVWKPRQKCRLIESIFLRIPLPAFYFSSSKDGLLQVVDGVQRLSAIRDFAKDDGYELQDLEFLNDELRGKRFSDLHGTQWMRRFNLTQVMAHVIDPQTPDRVKFDIFKRINTGGNPLNAQEIRHCMSGKRSRSFLKECTQLQSFITATNGVLAKNVRMVDREVVLRFCAFRDMGADKYFEYATMDDFLMTETVRIDNELSSAQVTKLLHDFEQAMVNSYALFGDHAFRKWPIYSDKVNPFNKALFEAWSVALADYSTGDLLPRRDQIVNAARSMMTDNPDFISAISASTGDPYRVTFRFTVVDYLLRGELDAI
ncbi:MAG TPA: DUF262 domain-containing protein [Capsulimonadaceae bacterium]|jgi:hypothetical protein